MFETGRKRKERIRAKREAHLSQEEELNDPDATLTRRPDLKHPKDHDGHVKAARGRTARQRRRKLRKDGRATAVATPEDEAEASNWLHFFTTDGFSLKPSTLRARRQDRHKDRARRSGYDRPEARVRPIGVVWVSWRWLSGSISLFLAVILYAMLGSNIFVVESISVGGERYVSPEWVFETTNVAGRNLFHLDAQDIEARLESSPSIADAQVFLDWPPNAISVFVIERDPVLVWDQGDLRVWIDINGTVMFRREERPDLLRIAHTNPDAEPLGAGSRIDREIVAGALQLQAKRPSIEVLLYDPIRGLGFREDEGNWVAWFGTGTDMERRLMIYDQIIRTNYPAVQFSEINVSDADYPYYVDRYAE